MSQTQAIKETVKEYLLDNFLGRENSDELTDETPLVTGGILDSITTLQLVAFLEEKYKVEFEPNELEQDNLNTISRIAGFVESKMKTA